MVQDCSAHVSKIGLAVDNATWDLVQTHKDKNVVYNQQYPGNSGKLERNPPVGVLIFAVLDLVMEEHARCCDHVGQQTAANVAQGVLIQRSPWRVSGSEEDRLHTRQCPWLETVEARVGSGSEGWTKAADYSRGQKLVLDPLHHRNDHQEEVRVP